MRHETFHLRVGRNVGICVCWPFAGAARHSQAAEAPVISPVTVGTLGNEPIVLRAPDGTLYISALQHFYRSTDGGATWSNLVGPPEASQLNLNSDSSISVDPNNRVYFTFDYPYAGTTAVCTSDDKGDTWTCNPAVVPGGTDRMWVLSPTATAAYEVTNEGLYETGFLMSTASSPVNLPGLSPFNGVSDPTGDGKYEVSGTSSANMPQLDILHSGISKVTTAPCSAGAPCYRIDMQMNNLSLAPTTLQDPNTNLVWLTQWFVPSTSDPITERIFTFTPSLTMAQLCNVSWARTRLRRREEA